jgi:hypothetical protein
VEVWTIDFVVQSRRYLPQTKKLLIFETEAEAVEFYKRHKRWGNWPWEFYTFPKKMEKEKAEAKMKELGVV